ncbi:hypothetical protein MLD38_039575 [Melastoma candidum]|uniref:Uncharacterized protein n=1 Tax=Melastoma candidum TaxID=119954 RepID=A0ACB9L4V5_9MYRT|nr:hypothetical protein MLD38_039575 [Melastoma candidum]
MDCVKNGCSIEQAGENEVLLVSSSRKRFYECIFCKRGFTNAQALGGHMNIHRKDRRRIGGADSKPVRASSSSLSRSHVAASKPYAPARDTNPCPSKYMESFFDVQYPSSLRRNYEILGANLSLKIGSSLDEDVDLGKIIKHEEHEEDEIDLELRLGYC